MTFSSRRFNFIPVCLIWLSVIAAGVAAGLLRGLDWPSMWPVAAIAAGPAILAVILTPVIHREWAQILVILGWLALAVIAVLGISFVPMAILFMCAPAAAALFEREKVVEAMVISALVAIVLFYAAKQGIIPDSPTSGFSRDWGQNMGIFATLAFLIGTLMTTAHDQNIHHLASAPSPETLKVPESLEANVKEKAEEKLEDIASAPIMAAAPIAALAPGIVTVEDEQHLSSDNSVNFDMFPGKFFLLDKQNKIIDLNQSARAEFDLQDGTGADFGFMLGLDEDQSKDVNDLIDRVRKTGSESSDKILLSSDNDRQDSLHLTARPIENGDVAISVQNLNEDYQNRLELKPDSETVRQESDEKSLFFAGVSHELRTPLNAIIGFSDMMRSRLFGPLPGKYAEYADMIHDSGQHMLDLIGDVLDLSKIGAGQYELKYDTFQAEDIIRSSIKMIRPTADAAELTLEANIEASEDIIIEADRRAVRQILLNLLSNAIKFSPKGSLVQVNAERDEANLRISVIDQGEGMSSEMVEKIGQPYLNNPDEDMSTPRGTGLGLSLVKSLVELHDGELNVHSQIGTGTTIHVDLPIERRQV